MFTPDIVVLDNAHYQCVHDSTFMGALLSPPKGLWTPKWSTCKHFTWWNELVKRFLISAVLPDMISKGVTVCELAFEANIVQKHRHESY